MSPAQLLGTTGNHLRYTVNHIDPSKRFPFLSYTCTMKTFFVYSNVIFFISKLPLLYTISLPVNASSPFVVWLVPKSKLIIVFNFETPLSLLNHVIFLAFDGIHV